VRGEELNSVYLTTFKYKLRTEVIVIPPIQLDSFLRTFSTQMRTSVW